MKKVVLEKTVTGLQFLEDTRRIFQHIVVQIYWDLLRRRTEILTSLFCFMQKRLAQGSRIKAVVYMLGLVLGIHVTLFLYMVTV